MKKLIYLLSLIILVVLIAVVSAVRLDIPVEKLEAKYRIAGLPHRAVR